MKEEIQKFFRGEVEDDEATLAKYSHDASLLEVRPAVVVYPLDAEDVKSLVRWVGENKDKYPGLSITARCAGTDMSGGAIGESVIMDFTRHMNKPVGGPLPMQQKSEWEISVQPGMFYRDFEIITLSKGLILPCYTASKSLNAMGGMYGNNSAGERTLKYGKTENYVLKAKVVFTDGNEYIVRPLTESELKKKLAQGGPEGEIYRRIYRLITENADDINRAKPNVRKNSAGYYIWNVMSDSARKENSPVLLHPTDGTLRLDNFPLASAKATKGFADGRFQSKTGGMSKNLLSLEPFFDLNKLLVGSQGTLGIVTEITFKIIPDNRYSKLVTIFMDDLEPLGRLVDEILTQNPETLESYDDKTLKLAVRFFPDFLKKRGLLGMFRLAWSFLPEFSMLLRGGFPKLVLLVEFAGTSEAEVQADCLKLVEKIKDFKLKVHITKNTKEASKYWDIRRESFALLRKHVKGMRTAPFIDDIIVRPEFLPKFIPELNAVLGRYKLTYTLAGHAGDGNFHIIPLMDFSRPDTAAIIMELSDKVYDLVLRYRGSITAEHNDGLIRTPYLRKMYGEKMTGIFTEIKNAFDPQNIFNPGKKVPTLSQGGTKEYIAGHIAVEHKAHHKV